MFERRSDALAALAAGLSVNRRKGMWAKFRDQEKKERHSGKGMSCFWDQACQVAALAMFSLSKRAARIVITSLCAVTVRAVSQALC